MKTKLTAVIMLLIAFSISTTNVYGMEINRAAMHTGDVEKGLILVDNGDEFVLNDALNSNLANSKDTQHEVYEVQKGDTLFSIAKNNEVELEDLMEWNDLGDYTIHPGAELVMFEDENEKDPLVMTADHSLHRETKIEAKKEIATEPNTSETSQPKVIQESAQAPASGIELKVTATAYTAFCEGCSGTTAIGIDLRSDPDQKVIAVDPNVIPLGSKVWVEGYGEAIAGDTGGAIKGNKIDVFIPTKDEALEWGRKEVKLKILN